MAETAGTCKTGGCNQPPWERTHSAPWPDFEPGCCFECAFWLHYAANPAPGTVVTDCRGSLERFEFDPASPVKPEGGLLGFSGAEWVIRFTDGRTVRTNDLWCQGTVPARFAHLFPVNAVFLDEHGDVLTPLLALPWTGVQPGDFIYEGKRRITVERTEITGDGGPYVTAVVYGHTRDGEPVTFSRKGGPLTYARRPGALRTGDGDA